MFAVDPVDPPRAGAARTDDEHLGNPSVAHHRVEPGDETLAEEDGLVSLAVVEKVEDRVPAQRRRVIRGRRRDDDGHGSRHVPGRNALFAPPRARGRSRREDEGGERGGVGASHDGILGAC